MPCHTVAGNTTAVASQPTAGAKGQLPNTAVSAAATAPIPADTASRVRRWRQSHRDSHCREPGRSSWLLMLPLSPETDRQNLGRRHAEMLRLLLVQRRTAMYI